MTGETAPTPSETIYEEGGYVSGYLADDTTVSDFIEALWDHLDKPVRIHREWLKPRWTTREELDDPERLYEMFGDHEMNAVSTDVVYDRVEDECEGAHLYVLLGLADDEPDVPPLSTTGLDRIMADEELRRHQVSREQAMAVLIAARVTTPQSSRACLAERDEARQALQDLIDSVALLAPNMTVAPARFEAIRRAYERGRDVVKVATAFEGEKS